MARSGARARYQLQEGAGAKVGKAAGEDRVFRLAFAGRIRRPRRGLSRPGLDGIVAFPAHMVWRRYPPVLSMPAGIAGLE